MSSDLPISRNLILSGIDRVEACPELILRTPLKAECQHDFFENPDFNLNIKLEYLQTSGCFKIRGILNQLHEFGCLDTGKHVCCVSKEKYSKAMIELCCRLNLSCTIFDVDVNSPSRVLNVKGQNIDSVNLPPCLVETFQNKLIRDPSVVFLHEYDCQYLISGYASIGKEILEECPDVDIVIVPVGGGGLISGIISALELYNSDRKCKVYGVELEQACSMYRSLKADSPVPVNNHIYCPNFRVVGNIGFEYCKRYVDDIILVSENDVNEAFKMYWKYGMKVEKMGAIGLAAIISNKVPNIQNKNVVTIASGSNVTSNDFNLDSFIVDDLGIIH